jgi:hypothetical protein
LIGFRIAGGPPRGLTPVAASKTIAAMRLLKLGSAVVLVLGVLAVAAPAQTSVPTVAVTVSRSAVTVNPAGPIAAGPTRFTFTSSGKAELNADLVTLRAGVTADQVRRAASRNPERALALVFLEGGVALGHDAASDTLTVTLRPNTTYYVVSSLGRSVALAPLATTGTSNGARAPKPDARIRMVDYGFRGPKALPRRGVIRVANQGAAFHFAIAFPLRPGASARHVGRALRSGSERGIGRLVAGPPVNVQNLISPGTVNDETVRFGRRGRFAFVCFFGEHNRLGMYRIFRVR